MPKVHVLIITFPKGHRREGEVYNLMTIRDDHLHIFQGRMGAAVYADGTVQNHEPFLQNLGRWYPEIAAKLREYGPAALLRLVEPGVMYDPHKSEV
ncbi:hypothetical protein GWN26_05925 [Candidatus Saccharibacteria bacterium]|nr:hypothetical protein [Candidatus Saccharibacteria bacterium]NIV03632.1 hypothetical protein [Calditrichia bacterium]NIS38169.1 hypothetical protein [Candidatus Saccharibacteria bacterium]NIV71925.1 hypothetical protein [Calditrichia bacterium]NIV98695.1 hypothetical protein [Candidatus Saccharibacteria bacterium]